MPLKDYFKNQRQNYEYKLLKENEARRQALADMIKIAEEAGLYEEPEPTFDEINNAIKRVRELHKLVIEDNAACGDIDCCGEYEEYELCADCYCEYPCPTIKALDGE